MGLGAVIAPPCTLRASLPLPAPRRQHCCWSGGEEGGGGRNAAPGAGRVPPRRAAEGGSNFDCFIAGMNLASLILDVASSLPGLIVSSVSPSPPVVGTCGMRRRCGARIATQDGWRLGRGTRRSGSKGAEGSRWCTVAACSATVRATGWLQQLARG